MWMKHATALEGFNLLFDLEWLRAAYHPWRAALSGRHQIIDAAYLNALDNEARAERGLKPLARILLGQADWSLADDTRFDRADDPRFLYYNALDSHITALVTAALARRILT